jgi:hypothetical protein
LADRARELFGLGTSEERRIAVEIKSFVGDSEVDDLEKAMGQYVLYLAVLAVQDPGRPLFLAVPHLVLRNVFDEPLGHLLVEDQSVRIVGFDPLNEVITRWIL